MERWRDEGSEKGRTTARENENEAIEKMSWMFRDATGNPDFGCRRLNYEAQRRRYQTPAGPIRAGAGAAFTCGGGCTSGVAVLFTCTCREKEKNMREEGKAAPCLRISTQARRARRW
jgi:hypothetical protein